MKPDLIELQKQINKLRRRTDSLETLDRPLIPDVDVPLIDYFSDSTKAGWTSYVNSKLDYMKFGNLVVVSYRISGESNAINCSFTVPYPEGESGAAAFHILRTINDDVVYHDGHGYLVTSTVSFQASKSLGIVSWTASGTKSVRGQFFYFIS